MSLTASPAKGCGLLTAFLREVIMEQESVSEANRKRKCAALERK
jgi:hypothetical protein